MFRKKVSSEKNRISLLTGKNGSGKSATLASIANAFYGALHSNEKPDTVRWERAGDIFETKYSDSNPPRVLRPRLVAQTFTPFSRFPQFLIDEQTYSSLFSESESGQNEYIAIGFANRKWKNIETLTSHIIEEGLVRLSENRKSVRAITNILHELQFDDGMILEYEGLPVFKAIASIVGQPGHLEDALLRSRKTGTLSIKGYRPFNINNSNIFNEARENYLQRACNFIREAIRTIQPHQRAGVSAINTGYVFSTFASQSATDDFKILRAFSLLRQLGLISLKRCDVKPSGARAIDVKRASSGQQQLLCSFFGLVSALADDTIILIDEPELSLHPQWQINFIPHLNSVLNAFSGCHVVIATHSALIAQSALSHGIEIIPLTPRTGLSNIGEKHDVSVEEALTTIFETPIPSNLHVANEMFSLISNAESGTESDLMQAKRRIVDYLQIYSNADIENAEMLDLLKKALSLVHITSQRRGMNIE